MKRYTITGKEVRNFAALTAVLKAAGFKFVAVLGSVQASGPVVWANVADDDIDPTPAVLAYQDPPVITVSSDHPDGPFGHNQAVADGVDKQTLTIQMVDALAGNPVAWNGDVVVQPQGPIARSPGIVSVVNGVGTFTVGPTMLPGEYDIFLQLKQDSVGYSRFRLHLAFF